MQVFGMLGALTSTQGGLAFLRMAKRLIHYSFGDYPNGPFDLRADIEEHNQRLDAQAMGEIDRFNTEQSIRNCAKKNEFTDIAYYATKGLLYSWSAYNFATNNPNPIDIIVSCAAAAETTRDVCNVMRRAI